MAENIRLLKSGRYQVRLQKEGVSYKETFDTIREAKIFKAEIISGKSAKPTNSPKSKIPTFNDLWETYQNGSFWKRKKETTKHRELQCLPFILEKLGHLTIDKIKNSTITDYKDSRSAETYLKKKVPTLYSGTAIRLEMCLISAVFTYCITQRGADYEAWLWKNPCQGIEKPPVVSKVVRVDTTDYLKLLNYLEKSNDRTAIFMLYMLQIAYHTGMRVSEIGRLEWTHFIQSRKSGGMLIWIPLSKNGQERKIPANDYLANLVKQIFEWKNTDQHLIAEGHCPYIFWSKSKEGVYKPYNPIQFLKKIRDKLGIENPISFHHFRHEYISKLFEAKESSQIQISRWTGHRTLQVLNNYTHFADED